MLKQQERLNKANENFVGEILAPIIFRKDRSFQLIS